MKEAASLFCQLIDGDGNGLQAAVEKGEQSAA
jgi:hypothetical protein